MEKQIRNRTVLGVFVCIALALVIYSKLSKKEYVDPLEAERKARLEFDIKTILNDSNQDPGTLYRAMFEIARESYPAAVLSRIQSFETSPEILIRSGVVYSLAYQRDVKSKEIVAKMIHDPEATVRSQVIHAARERPGPDQVSLLNDYLSIPKINEVEKIQAKGVLYLSLPKGSQADSVLESLLSSIDLSSKSSVSDLALLQANSIAPTHPKVIALDQKALGLSHHPAVLSVAIRTLAQRNDPALHSHFAEFIHSKDATVKRAAIESLSLTCPSKRWDFIREGYPEESDFAGRTPWILAAERLKGEDAKLFLASALREAEKSKIEIEIKAIQASILRLDNSKAAAPCLDK